MYRDYASRGVDFIYVYKSLAHPELSGYVQPFTLKERLMHVKEARRTLGTDITWICDGMDNAIKKGFGNAPNSEWVIDPDGIIVRTRVWSDPKALRADLVELIGPVETPTRVADLDLPTASPPAPAPRGVVPRVERPQGARALVVRAESTGEQPLYAKLRAEGTRDLLVRGTGTLYVGFHLDPLYGVHWNNLVDPIAVELRGPDGIRLSASTLTGPKVRVEADADPREFVIDVAGAPRGSVLTVTARYFACNDAEGWCKPVTQRYAVELVADPHGGRVLAPRGNDRGRQLLRRFDADGDGTLSREELPERMRATFDRMDADGDGALSADELARMRNRRRGGG